MGTSTSYTDLCTIGTSETLDEPARTCVGEVLGLLVVVARPPRRVLLEWVAGAVLRLGAYWLAR